MSASHGSIPALARKHIIENGFLKAIWMAKKQPIRLIR
jgi:hypothetical protein